MRKVSRLIHSWFHLLVIGSSSLYSYNTIKVLARERANLSPEFTVITVV